MTESDDKLLKVLSRASAAHELRRYEDVLREARAAIAIDPSLETGYAYAAHAELGLGEPRKALELARAGLGLHPQSQSLNRSATSAALALGFNHVALAFADDAVRFSPQNSHAHNIRGDCLKALRRRDEARTAYESAIELAPNNAPHHRDLGTFLLGSDPAEAALILRKSLDLDPLSAITHNNLGVALHKLKRPDEATFAFRTALRLDPTLNVAKENIHSAVSGLLGKPVTIATMVLAGFAWAQLAVVAGAAAVIITATVALVLGGIIWLSVPQTKTRNREELDPDLLRLYDQIDADVKAKRL